MHSEATFHRETGATNQIDSFWSRAYKAPLLSTKIRGEISSDLYSALVNDMKKHVVFRWQLSKNPFAHS